ncbi:hypothetical protein D3C87_1152540 [compost metagenome]
MGNGAGGQIEHNRLTVGTRRGKGNGVGAEQRPIGAVGHDAGHAVDHAERHQPFIGKGLDVRPQRGEMVRIADRQDCDAGAAGFFHQQCPGSSEGRLRETVAGIDPHESRSHILNHRNGLAVYPAAVQGRDITGNAEHSVTVRTVAFGAGAVLCQHPSDIGRRAVTQEDLLKQCRQFSQRQVLRDNSRHMIVWRRHLKLQTNYWRGQQRT